MKNCLILYTYVNTIYLFKILKEILEGIRIIKENFNTENKYIAAKLFYCSENIR